ncbi:MAG TPA: CobD/CbiB family cobalamin biosynthesis protein, partial [Rhizomicrobium sp.]|jgi:adenosylcobinamide-phosphate synthase|nr:CobD/CbiB family cobalamin biosynthesis protein [Rhizomicrobium sp.]
VLDQSAIRRAAIESLAENLSDGVVAPLFWGLIAGLPGIVIYKLVNTADSMIGHRTERHLYFGWASARLDDVLNWLPARLTGLMIAAVSGTRVIASLGAMIRDARAHRSPNAGWPEAAMAGALGVRLSGPRLYRGVPANEPWLNESGADPDNAALRQSLHMMVKVCALEFVLVAASAFYLHR